jgi:hypothetical protein
MISFWLPTILRCTLRPILYIIEDGETNHEYELQIDPGRPHQRLAPQKGKRATSF